tara:strand:+ start:2017 stop:2274 length:258 start_codon:yes stop_codon:yes gene_type:complete
MNRPQVLKELMAYFDKKGKILSIDEYKAADDAPMRYMVAKRAFGSWARMHQMAMAAGWGQTAEQPAPKPKPKAKAAPKKAAKKVD